MRYNLEHGITPKQIVKGRNTLLDNEQLKETREMFGAVIEPIVDKQKIGTSAKQKSLSIVADGTTIDYQSVPDLQKEIDKTREAMLTAAKALDFLEAAHKRDYMLMLQERLDKLTKK